MVPSLLHVDVETFDQKQRSKACWTKQSGHATTRVRFAIEYLGFAHDDDDEFPTNFHANNETIDERGTRTNRSPNWIFSSLSDRIRICVLDATKFLRQMKFCSTLR